MVPGTFARWCTHHYKTEPISRWRVANLGASPINPTETWIGISTDESKRARAESLFKNETLRYPLLELGLSRTDCEQIIRDAGLPVPPKSGCFFCPFKSRSQWQQMKYAEPEAFGRALAIEKNAHGRDGRPKYLPIFGPLQAVADQGELPGFDEAIAAEAGCITGACFV